jgi:hypothetical protein
MKIMCQLVAKSHEPVIVGFWPLFIGWVKVVSLIVPKIEKQCSVPIEGDTRSITIDINLGDGGIKPKNDAQKLQQQSKLFHGQTSSFQNGQPVIQNSLVDIYGYVV